MTRKYEKCVCRKKRRRILLGGLLLMSSLFFAGCGKTQTEGTEVQNTELTDFVYVPEFIELKLHEDVEADYRFLNSVKLVEGKLLYHILATNPGEQVANTYIYTREQDDFRMKAEVPRKALPNGEKEVINFCTYDREGNFYVIWERRGEKSWQVYDFLSKYDKDYNLVYTKELTDVWVNESNADITQMVFDTSGRVYACASSILYIFDENGELEKNIRLGTQGARLFVQDDGKVYMAFWDTGTGGTLEFKLAEINVETGKREEPIEGLPYGCKNARKGINNKILLNRTGGLWEFDMETKESKELFTWTDMSVNVDSIKSLSMTENGELIILHNIDNSNPLFYEYEIVYLKKVDRSQVKEKEVITIATLYESEGFLTEAVADYNRKNNRYRVEIKGYLDEGTEYTPEGYQDALNRFHADLVSGQAGDLINLKYMDWRNLARKGALEELAPYMTGNLHKEDFVESVVNAYEVGGKCYTIPRGFGIETLMGKASIVGSREDWSLEQVKELADRYPDASLIHMSNPYMLLQCCMQYGGKAFIDYEKAECDFDNQEFMDILEFSKQGGDGQTTNTDLYSNVKMDRVLLAQVSIKSVEEYQMYRQLFGGEGVCVGYPTVKDGGQSDFSGEEMLAIASGSKNKETAWAFLENFLQQENKSPFAFPTLVKGFEGEIEDASKVEYLYDEDGQQQYDEKGQPLQKMKTTWGYGSFNAEIYAATETEITELREILKYASCNQTEERIREFINEEAGPYFEGQKSAPEVAEIIQNRVQLYLFENAE